MLKFVRRRQSDVGVGHSCPQSSASVGPESSSVSVSVDESRSYKDNINDCDTQEDKRTENTERNYESINEDTVAKSAQGLSVIPDIVDSEPTLVRAERTRSVYAMTEKLFDSIWRPDENHNVGGTKGQMSNGSRDDRNSSVPEFNSNIGADEMRDIKRSLRKMKGPSGESKGANLRRGSSTDQGDLSRKSSNASGMNGSAQRSSKDSVKRPVSKTSSAANSEDSKSTNSEDQEFVIPKDGNVSTFTADQMAAFFRYMGLSDSIVTRLRRYGVDGRKFSRTNDADMEAICGAKNPILVFFRDRSKPPNTGGGGQRRSSLWL